MHVPADTVEHENPLLLGVELGAPPPAAARLVHILPNPKHLVDDARGADLKFVVSVRAGDENFEIVLLINLGVAFGERSPDVGLFGSETEVEVLVIPKKAHSRIEPGGRARNNIDECGRRRRMLPTRFIQMPVDVDGRAGTVADVAG